MNQQLKWLEEGDEYRKHPQFAELREMHRLVADPDSYLIDTLEALDEEDPVSYLLQSYKEWAKQDEEQDGDYSHRPAAIDPNILLLPF